MKISDIKEYSGRTRKSAIFNISNYILPMDIYTRVKEKSRQIKEELRSLGYWQATPLPPERYVDMGAFGSNTMAFEQWLQFILIPRIQEIVENRGDLPSGSALGTYAIRVWDGRPDVGRLHSLLYELDRIVNDEVEDDSLYKQPDTSQHEPTSFAGVVSIDGTSIPPVLCTIADLLPTFSGNDLEAQLQTFDTFLEFLSATVRPSISEMLRKAAGKCADDGTRRRIKEAAESVLRGGRAAAPYDHDEAMKKNQADHLKSFSREE